MQHPRASQPASHPPIPLRRELLWDTGRGGGRAHLGGREVYLFCYNVAAAAVVTTRPHVVRVVGRSRTACRFGAPDTPVTVVEVGKRGRNVIVVAKKKPCALAAGSRGVVGRLIGDTLARHGLTYVSFIRLAHGVDRAAHPFSRTSFKAVKLVECCSSAAMRSVGTQSDQQISPSSACHTVSLADYVRTM